MLSLPPPFHVCLWVKPSLAQPSLYCRNRRDTVRCWCVLCTSSLRALRLEHAMFAIQQEYRFPLQLNTLTCWGEEGPNELALLFSVGCLGLSIPASLLWETLAIWGSSLATVFAKGENLHATSKYHGSKLRDSCSWVLMILHETKLGELPLTEKQFLLQLTGSWAMARAYNMPAGALASRSSPDLWFLFALQTRGYWATKVFLLSTVAVSPLPFTCSNPITELQTWLILNKYN